MVIDTPVAAWTSVVPLVLVVSVTALKQGYEDYRRHRADNKVNNAPAKRLTKDGVKVQYTKEIQTSLLIQFANKICKEGMRCQKISLNILHDLTC